jgi:transcriptional regulator with XRE-family HTH domain/DNA polymerase III delta prime subunit
LRLIGAKNRGKHNLLLTQARVKRHLTQQQLAEVLGVGLTTVRHWEAGRRSPSLSLRARLCEFFHLSPEELGLELETEKVLTPFFHDKDVSTLSPVIDGTDISPGTITGSFSLTKSQFEPYTLVNRLSDQNRRRFLIRIRKLWIDDVLAHSLHNAVLLTLGLVDLPDALMNPWRYAVQETERPARPFPEGTTIVQLYDQADHELLILGEPGAGKTTLLLELTRVLLQRAEKDKDAFIPAVFNLSSWTGKHTSLIDWLVGELSEKYRIPRNIAKEWVETDRLALLLDGLDETLEEERVSCVKAITAYQQNHQGIPLVVSCRRDEYFAQATRVDFRQAVLIQPLTNEQIDQYLNCVEGRLEAVQNALRDDAELMQMLQSPLMLNIIALIYQSGNELPVLTGSPTERRRQILMAYVQRMLMRRKAPLYPLPQTIRWLSWLAQQMQHSQTEFAVERMQPGGLPTSRLRCSYQDVIIRLYHGFTCLVFAGLFSWIRGGKMGSLSGVGEGLLGSLGANPGNDALGWMAPGIGGGIEGGGSLAIILMIVSALITLLHCWNSSWDRKCSDGGAQKWMEWFYAR